MNRNVKLVRLERFCHAHGLAWPSHAVTASNSGEVSFLRGHAVGFEEAVKVKDEFGMFASIERHIRGDDKLSDYERRELLETTLEARRQAKRGAITAKRLAAQGVEIKAETRLGRVFKQGREKLGYTAQEFATLLESKRLERAKELHAGTQLGQFLQIEREHSLGITRQEIAKKLGIDSRIYQEIESGVTVRPADSILKRIAKKFEVDFDQLKSLADMDFASLPAREQRQLLMK